MSDRTQSSPAEDTSSTPPRACLVDGPEAKPEAPQSNHAPDAMTAAPDPTEALKRRLEETRLPADVKEQILAELPSPEEQERLYRELQENGGLSSEQFFASLGLDVEPQP